MQQWHTSNDDVFEKRTKDNVLTTNYCFKIIDFNCILLFVVFVAVCSFYSF
jgi:hypothetical protein